MHAYCVIEIRPDLSRTLHVGQHDGGEKESGERLSRLLQALQCENVVVAVSCWYGGVELGSNRWRMILTVAKEARLRNYRKSVSRVVLVIRGMESCRQAYWRREDFVEDNIKLLGIFFLRPTNISKSSSRSLGNGRCDGIHSAQICIEKLAGILQVGKQSWRGAKTI
jgi:hypothetical protein